MARWKPVQACRRRPRPVFVGLCSLAVLAGALEASGGAATAQPRPTHLITGDLASELAPSSSVSLPPASTTPAPASPTVAAAPLAPHEVFAFAPYWTLPQSSGFAVGDISTIAYFSLDVNGDGTIDESGSGWDGYQSQDLVDLITRAHQAGDRVVLTATCFSQASLDALTHTAGAGQTLGAALVGLVEAKDLDGVNLDFEGSGSADRTGLDQVVADVAEALHLADPHYQLTMDTYGSSASDPDGFYDIQDLAPSVDAFFVMAYDMDDPSVPGPTAPLAGPGYTDQSVVAQYTAVVPADKVILGTPFYGYSWPTTGPALGDAATGGPTAVTYAEVAGSGDPVYWDPTTDTPWSSYDEDGQWHQVFFDDADSLAMKAALASRAGLLGVGVWALGMDGGDPTLLSALLGGASPTRLPPVGPVSTTDAVHGPSAPRSASHAAPASATRHHRHRAGGGAASAGTAAAGTSTSPPTSPPGSSTTGSSSTGSSSGPTDGGSASDGPTSTATDGDTGPGSSGTGSTGSSSGSSGSGSTGSSGSGSTGSGSSGSGSTGSGSTGPGSTGSGSTGSSAAGTSSTGSDGTGSAGSSTGSSPTASGDGGTGGSTTSTIGANGSGA